MSDSCATGSVENGTVAIPELELAGEVSLEPAKTGLVVVDMQTTSWTVTALPANRTNQETT